MRRALFSALVLGGLALALPALSQPASSAMEEVDVLVGWVHSAAPRPDRGTGDPLVTLEAETAGETAERVARTGRLSLPYLFSETVLQGRTAVFRITGYGMLPPGLQVRSAGTPLEAAHLRTPPAVLVTPYLRDGVQRIGILLQGGAPGDRDPGEGPGAMTRTAYWSTDVALEAGRLIVVSVPSEPRPRVLVGADGVGISSAGDVAGEDVYTIDLRPRPAR